MFADDGEYIEFNQPVTIEGPSENWLLGIEKAMRVTLKDVFKQVRAALRKNLKTRDKWLLACCGQLCLTSSQVISFL